MPFISRIHSVDRLFGGAVDAATRIGHWVAADWFDPQSPSIFWPEDHRWCVATEVDADSTLVGGSRELVEEVMDSPLLEAPPIARDALPLDTINPVVKPVQTRSWKHLRTAYKSRQRFTNGTAEAHQPFIRVDYDLCGRSAAVVAMCRAGASATGLSPAV